MSWLVGQWARCFAQKGRQTARKINLQKDRQAKKKDSRNWGVLGFVGCIVVSTFM